MKIRKILRKINNYIPAVPLAIFCLCALSAVIHLISANSVAFSDFFNRYISSGVRAGLAFLTNFLPFSLAEYILLCMPAVLVILIAYCIKITADDGRPKKKKRSAQASPGLAAPDSSLRNDNDTTGGTEAATAPAEEEIVATRYSYAGRITRYITSLLSSAALIYTIFVLGFATGYQGSGLEDKLGLDRRTVSADELHDTAVWLLEESERELDSITFLYGSSSVMLYSLDEMNDRLNDAYASVSDRYDFVPSLRSNVKYVLLSEPMTYTHISGVYTFFTGEANLNINFPDYTLPYTAAHELSHQRGIAREDEANFMAFLVCSASDDPYIRYSGYLNLYEYVISALYSADIDLYYEVAASADRRIRSEMAAYSEFFNKYRENIAADISGAVNNSYLKTQGQQEGTKSYGRVVDLAVAYYKASVN